MQSMVGNEAASLPSCREHRQGLSVTSSYRVVLVPARNGPAWVFWAGLSFPDHSRPSFPYVSPSSVPRDFPFDFAATPLATSHALSCAVSLSRCGDARFSGIRPWLCAWPLLGGLAPGSPVAGSGSTDGGIDGIAHGWHNRCELPC